MNKQLGINSIVKNNGLSKLNVSNVVKAATGDYHTFLLTKDGDVYAFGKNSYGQAGLGKNES